MRRGRRARPIRPLPATLTLGPLRPLVLLLRLCWYMLWRCWPVLAIAVILAWASLHYRHTGLQTWQYGYQNAQCVGPVCLVTQPYWELSVNEYATPTPTWPPLAPGANAPVPGCQAYPGACSGPNGYHP